MRFTALAVALAALLAAATPAAATASFGCEIDDTSLRFNAESAVSRGFGGKILDLKAEAEVRLAGAPKDFGKINLDQNLVHSWIDGKEFRLLFYHERTGNEPHATFELVIRTVADEDEIGYSGTYELSMFTMDPPNNSEGRTLNAEGKVTCSMG